MVPGAMTTEEQRIRELEMRLIQLDRALAGLKDKLGQSAEDGLRQSDDYGGGRTFWRCQSVGVVQASTGATLGTGTVRLLQVIGGIRYKLQPLSQGDVTVPAVNDTGSPTVDKEFGIGAWIDGVFTLLVGDCATATPVIAPDPPAG